MRRVLGGQISSRQGAGVGVLVAAGALAAAINGCSAPGEGSSGFTSTGTGGTNSSGTVNTSGTNSGAGGDDLITVGVGGSTGSSMGTGQSCAGTSSEANLIPVNMFIMFDKSKSMDEDGKWTNTSKALVNFFKDQGSAGLRVALRFFPDSGCDDDSCNVNVCSQPLVPLGPLTSAASPTDSQEKLLVDAVGSKTPDGGTPMSVALGGAEKWASSYQTAHPSEKTVVVLVTDGEPNGCEVDVNYIAALAAKAKNTNGILTYAVGLEGSNTSTINKIAASGGTTKGIFVGNGNASAELLAALKAIQGSQVACDFQMPQKGNMGEMIDPTLVNVNYTPGDGGMLTTFGQVAKESDCTAQKGGWFYDDALKPTTITLCPTTCASVQADEKAKIEIEIGCATKPAQ